jgi:peptide/nickel transport system substrate-binding protein
LTKDRKWLRLLAVLTALMLIAAACGGGDDDEGAAPGTEQVPEGEVPTGGTLKVAGASDVDFMDPAAMYYVLSWWMARGVHRTLVTYPVSSDVEEQNTVVPDLATDTGQSNEDATEWTFTLRDGIKFGPALGGEEVPGVTGEEITSDDIKYAMERLWIPSVGAGYNFYYDVLEGSQEFADGKADTISGIETPDDKTIVFHLTEPTGDWPLRMAMPATSPVAREAAEQYDKKKDSNYDQHVVATGPYYISEWTPEERIVLERNEHWDKATDDVRPAYVDSLNWQLGFDNDVGVQQVFDGDFHLGMDVSPQGPALEKVINDPELKSRFINESAQCNRYVYMNTTIEPFDNQQVREAVNWAIDRANLKRLQGGPVTGPIATSILPEGMGGYLSPEEYNPFETPNMAGDMDKAKELMAEAGFENGYDGEVLLVGASDPPHDRYLESVRTDLEELGFSNITTKAPAFPNQYTQFYQVTDSETAVGSSAGWCKDYNDAFTFMDPLLNGDNIDETGANQNYSEIDDPELNRLIEEASALPPGDERDAAWEEANKKATELAVWVPWTWDNETIIYSEGLVNPIFNNFFAHVDWVAAGVTQE